MDSGCETKEAILDVRGSIVDGDARGVSTSCRGLLRLKFS